MSAKGKKLALICPTCGAKAFARLPRMCGGDLSPYTVPVEGARVGHALTPMVSAALYHSRRASGVNPAPAPLQFPRGVK